MKPFPLSSNKFGLNFFHTEDDISYVFSLIALKFFELVLYLHSITTNFFKFFGHFISNKFGCKYCCSLLDNSLDNCGHL